MGFIDNSRVWKNEIRSTAQAFFEQFGFIKQATTNYDSYWCNEKKNIGMYVYYNPSTKGLQCVYNNGSNHIVTIDSDFFNTDGTGYWQTSADEKVIYLQSAPEGDEAKRTHLIIAEMEDKNWGMIWDTSLCTPNGVQTISDAAVTPNRNGEFTAVKMRDPETGVNFTSLYRVLSAPCFTPAGMYVDFGGTPMRAATVQTANDTDAKICFAFPVA